MSSFYLLQGLNSTGYSFAKPFAISKQPTLYGGLRQVGKTTLPAGDYRTVMIRLRQNSRTLFNYLGTVYDISKTVDDVTEFEDTFFQPSTATSFTAGGLEHSHIKVGNIITDPNPPSGSEWHNWQHLQLSFPEDDALGGIGFRETSPTDTQLNTGSFGPNFTILPHGGSTSYVNRGGWLQSQSFAPTPTPTPTPTTISNGFYFGADVRRLSLANPRSVDFTFNWDNDFMNPPAGAIFEILVWPNMTKADSAYLYFNTHGTAGSSTYHGTTVYDGTNTPIINIDLGANWGSEFATVVEGRLLSADRSVMISNTQIYVNN